MNQKIILSLAVMLTATVSQAQSLTLDQYLGQVRAGNDGYKSSIATADGAPNKSADADMVYATTVFANIQTAVDKKEMIPASQRGSETDNTSTQVGLSKMTTFGTAAKFYYNASQTTIHGTSNTFVPQPAWRETSPTIEVTHPLWKNAHGKDIAKSVELQQGQAEITKLSESLKRKATIAESEGYYWRLVLARESVRVAKENLERANRIIAWNQKRVSSELADSADLIQAEALGEVRDIELTMAIDEERAAAHAFNTARGAPGSAVKEDLTKITPELIASIPAPQKANEREDLKATIKAERLSELGADLASDKYDPSLDLFAMGAMNGRDSSSYSKANSESMKAKHTTYAVGLKFSAPLGGDSLSRVRSGYAKDKEAAALAVSRMRYENDREWSDLTSKLGESKSRLALTQNIEATQQRKLGAERSRQSKGRSTMSQVMQSETDYAAAQLNVIRNKAEILGIIARMKTFGGEG